MNKFKSKLLNEIEEKYSPSLSNISDLTAGDDPKLLFFINAILFGYMLDSDPNKTISKKGIDIRKYTCQILKTFGPGMLRVPQVFEDRNELMGENKYIDGKKIELPEEPVIWSPNHAFKDDPLSSVLAAYRSAYLFFGSLPQFFNTIDGFSTWLNGAVMIDRNSKVSREASMIKAKKLLDLGGDLIIYPEGVLNLSPNRLLLDFFPGVYRLSAETGAKVVPIIHYTKDKTETNKNDYIHTVVDEPIDFSNMTEKQGLEYLRDVMATWYYLMMEKYGKSTREELLGDFDTSTEAWEDSISARLGRVHSYDFATEFASAFKDGNIPSAEEVWKNIANVQNINSQNIQCINYAKMLIEEDKKNDYQHRIIPRKKY